MPLLIIFSVITFFFIGLIGFLCHKSKVWTWVDCLYYPLAAIGIILLFHNNSGQRQVVEAQQNQELLQKEQQLALENQPHVKVKMDIGLYEGYINLINSIPKLADICKESVSTPTCEAATKLSPMVTTFVSVANAGAGLPIEKRLLKVCNSAESMLLEIEKSKVLLSTTTQELIKNYKLLSQRNLGLGAYYEVSIANSVIKSKSLDQIQMLDEAVYRGSEAGDYVKQMQLALVDNATLILTALTPCLSTPNSELKQLNDWTETQITTQQSIDKYTKIIETSKNYFDPKTYAFQLNLWPFLLILALALKFGKGVSSVKPQCVAIYELCKTCWIRLLNIK